MKHTLFAGVGAVALGFAAPAMAGPTGGNILLTGHDNDYHCTVSGNAGNACGALSAEASYVRNGSTLPILSIDNGSELTSALIADFGAGNVVAKTVGQVTAGMFNHSTYSAFAVASVTTCGGCDNPFGTGTTLSAFSSAIASFYDAGGGILGLTAATDTAGFAYVPDAAAGAPIAASSGFVATSAGTSDIPGFFAVNGDQTHNVFPSFSPAYTVAETQGVGGPAVTLFLSGGAITCVGSACTVSHGVPEPMSLSLLGAGLFGLGAARRRWRH